MSNNSCVAASDSLVWCRYHALRLTQSVSSCRSIIVDTACSSSLVAIHLARGALEAGECHAALAAGTQCQLLPSTFGILSQLQALSSDGRCKTFSTAADGYGRGEGFAVCVVETVAGSAAASAAALVYLHGSAINQDGRSSSFTAPHGPAQQALMIDALASCGASPEAVAYLASHGTGTPLGDPIETGAAAKVLLPRGNARERTAVLAFGAVKVRLNPLGLGCTLQSIHLTGFIASFCADLSRLARITERPWAYGEHGGPGGLPPRGRGHSERISLARPPPPRREPTRGHLPPHHRWQRRAHCRSGPSATGGANEQLRRECHRWSIELRCVLPQKIWWQQFIYIIDQMPSLSHS